MCVDGVGLDFRIVDNVRNMIIIGCGFCVEVGGVILENFLAFFR